MGKRCETYTVMVLPSPTAEPYRFSLRKKSLYYLLAGSSFFALVLVGILIQYVVLIGQVAELNALREETQTQKVQIQGFLSTVSDLNQQMNRLHEFEDKMRVITNIHPEGKKQKASVGFSMGGPEFPEFGLEEDLEDRDREKRKEKEIEKGVSSKTQEISMDIQQNLTRLTSLAVQKEASFLEITKVMEGKQVLWASTPSIWPVAGWVSSGFGKRISPFTGKIAKHKGLDIAARPKTNVIAPANGVVVRAGFGGRFGKMIKIDHGFGMVTRYGHLAKITVRRGQRVRRGDLIGYVGSTGLSTGPHLHYEVIIKKKPVNPLRYILN